MKLKNTKLKQAIENHNLTPGSDLTNYVDASESTFKRWAGLGWVVDRGRWILTDLGYKNN